MASPLIAALERAWGDVRRRHPELPTAVIVTGSGADGRRSGLRLGQFAARRWRHYPEGGALPEIFVGGEGLERDARGVLATLLHEAAHALADVRGVKDTSRQGRYHNRRFKLLAEELGLIVTQVPVIGWSATSLADATAERYRDTLAALEHALTLQRRGEPPVGASGRSRNAVACACACGRRIQVAPSMRTRGAGSAREEVRLCRLARCSA